MLSTITHQCPRCGGAIPREHYTEREITGANGYIHFEQFLYCEFCSYGVEQCTYQGSVAYALDYQAATEPINFGKFLQRLEDARAA